MFDHTPMLVQVHQIMRGGTSPFRFYKMWCSDPEFVRKINEVWSCNMRGTAMFCVVQKMKLVKAAMKRLNKEGFNDIHIADTRAYSKLIECQRKLQENHNELTSANERQAANAYKEVHAKYIAFLQHKAKIDWLKQDRHKFSHVSSSY